MPKKAKRKPTRRPPSKEDQYRGVMMILLDMFAEVDEVFMHQDAFMEPRKALGRLYRKWKSIRAELDPDFDKKRYRRGRYE